MAMHIKPVMTTVELFCGIGGFRVAADKLGLKTVWANDISALACPVYRGPAASGQTSIVHGIGLSGPVFAWRLCVLVLFDAADALSDPRHSRACRSWCGSIDERVGGASPRGWRSLRQWVR